MGLMGRGSRTLMHHGGAIMTRELNRAVYDCLSNGSSMEHERLSTDGTFKLL
jgi:hypothetical protein